MLKKPPHEAEQYGAQTSFMSFLLSQEGLKEMKVPYQAILPFENEVLNIDENGMVFFNEKGNAYILNSFQKIYHFYSQKKLIDGKVLLDQIPFYFFFKALRKTKFNDEFICNEQGHKVNKPVAYSHYINRLLSNRYSI